MISAMTAAGISSRSVQRPVSKKTPVELDEAQQELNTIEAVKTGNVNAFQQLVETHQSRVYNLALRILGNEQEAQDAAQDAFVQAYTRLASYRSEWRFKTWIMAITSNLCIDRLRRRRIEPVTFSEQTEDPEFQYVSHEPQPDSVAIQHERLHVIQAMLGQLPHEDRDMVVMFYWGDMTYEEIAQVTGSTINAVKSRLFRARRSLALSPLANQLAESGRARSV